jgi:hypothetical protein
MGRVDGWGFVYLVSAPIALENNISIWCAYGIEFIACPDIFLLAYNLA